MLTDINKGIYSFFRINIMSPKLEEEFNDLYDKRETIHVQRAVLFILGFFCLAIIRDHIMTGRSFLVTALIRGSLFIAAILSFLGLFETYEKKYPQLISSLLLTASGLVLIGFAIWGDTHLSNLYYSEILLVLMFVFTTRIRIYYQIMIGLTLSIAGVLLPLIFIHERIADAIWMLFIYYGAALVIGIRAGILRENNDRKIFMRDYKIKKDQKEHTRLLWNLYIYQSLDPVTGLINRDTFFEKLKNKLHPLKKLAAQGTLVIIKVTNIDELIKELGLKAADDIINFLANYLELKLEKVECLLARMDFTEFIFFVEDRQGKEVIDIVKEDLSRIQNKIYHEKNYSTENNIDFVFGQAAYPGEGEDIDKLYIKATEDLTEVGPVRDNLA